MPDTKDISARQDAAVERIANALGVTVRDLRGDAPGNPPLARVLQMESIAEQVERVTSAKGTRNLRDAINAASDDTLIALPGIGEKSLADWRKWAKNDDTQEMPPVTVETVTEAPMATTETVQTMPASEVTGKGKGNAV